MLFLKSFLRRLISHKAFTFINLFGLTFALSFILLIGSYLLQENSFDKFYKNIDNIYIITDSLGNNANIDFRVKQILKDNLPEVKNAGIHYKVELHLNYLDKVFNEDKVVSVDNDFLSMFDIKLIKGNSQKPFNGLDDALVSESLAAKMFGTENPIGKQVLFNHKIPLTVVGVVKDFPSNSTLQGNFFVNAENKKMRFSFTCPVGENSEDKCSIPFHIFVQLQPGVIIKDVETKALNVIPKDSRYPSAIHFSPFKDFHLNRHLSISGVEQGNPGLLRILGSLVLIITLLALINYVNLTTAGYKLRLKETGVKKSLGAHRGSIVIEYILESVLMCLVAAYLSTYLSRLLLPSFNNFLHTQLNISFFANLKLNVEFFLFSIFIGILAGIYPALYLSMISPREVLASWVFTTRSGKLVRNILNVFQFTIAIVLITVILFMQKQIRFAKTQDLGFKTENLLRIDMSRQSAHSINLLMDKLRENPEIISMAPTTGVPANIQTHFFTDVVYAVIGIDSTFYKTFGIDVIEGRSLLSGDIDKACLINETARKTYADGIYLGKKIGDWEVVGVVKDFSVSSVHTKIEPLALVSITTMKPNNLTLRLSGNNIPALMDFIKKSWSEVSPDYPFQYNFYDSWFESMYRNEERLGKLISLFALLAIVISCIGILGLALFATEQRSKEIGLRKINGASTALVMFMITIDFTKWIFISFLISIPISYYAVDKWLSNFAYHTKIAWWIFALSGVISLLIALLTVGFQSWSAASKNPVEALRYD